MRLIRITLVGLALAAATAPMACGQEDPAEDPAAISRRVSGKRAMQMLLMDIHLDSAQTAKVDSIVVKYRAQMQGLRKDDGSRDEAARQRLLELLEQQQSDLRAVLTREQQAVFDKNAAKVRERVRMQNRKPSRSPG